MLVYIPAPWILWENHRCFFSLIIWYLRVTNLLHLWRLRHPGAASARRGLKNIAPGASVRLSLSLQPGNLDFRNNKQLKHIQTISKSSCDSTGKKHHQIQQVLAVQRFDTGLNRHPWSIPSLPLAKILVNLETPAQL